MSKCTLSSLKNRSLKWFNLFPETATNLRNLLSRAISRDNIVMYNGASNCHVSRFVVLVKMAKSGNVGKTSSVYIEFLT